MKDELPQKLLRGRLRLAWLNSGTRIMTCTVKYDRTCQRSIEIISIEKNVALYKSAQKRKIPGIFFLKERS